MREYTVGWQRNAFMPGRPITGQYMDFCAKTERRRPEAPQFNPNWIKRNHPIVNVNWDVAKAYCDWSGLQLPTEAQWENAARGTDGREYPWGNADPDETKLWFSQSSSIGTCSVTNYNQGPYKLYDLVGNVWQWCRDRYDINFWKNRPVVDLDPVNLESGNGRVLRGGSWGNDHHAEFRVVRRASMDPTTTNFGGGFRVVLRHESLP